MADIALIEVGEGGDLILSGNKLEAATGFENVPYLSMFGGVEWWGNEFLPEAQQFKSQTEAALTKYSLNSNGRVEIEKAINADLAIISENVPGTTIVATASIVSNDRLSIEVTINGRTFNYYWNPSERFLTYQI